MGKWKIPVIDMNRETRIFSEPLGSMRTILGHTWRYIIYMR